jgi:hypothetical protein
MFVRVVSVLVCLWYLCCCCVHYECRAAVHGAGCGCVLSLLCCVRGDVTGSIGDMIRSGRDGSGWAVGGAASGVAEGAAGGSCCVVDVRSRWCVSWSTASRESVVKCSIS